LQILVDEAVAAIDAMSRQGMSEALKLVTATAGTLAALRGMEALGPLRAMLLPLPLPTDMLHTLRPAVALSAEDRQVCGLVPACAACCVV
jgi:aarF domain-containing kinase